MTEWDKLWAEPHAFHAKWTSKEGYWIRRVKAEGDFANQVLKNWIHYFGECSSLNLISEKTSSLKEKADKWDSIQESPYLSHEDPEYIKGDAEFQFNKLKEAREKLKALTAYNAELKKCDPNSMTGVGYVVKALDQIMGDSE